MPFLVLEILIALFVRLCFCLSRSGSRSLLTFTGGFPSSLPGFGVGLGLLLSRLLRFGLRLVLILRLRHGGNPGANLALAVLGKSGDRK